MACMTGSLVNDLSNWSGYGGDMITSTTLTSINGNSINCNNENDMRITHSGVNVIDVKKYFIKPEKRIICAQNKFIDLNMVCNISDNGDSLDINMLNGGLVTICKPSVPLSYKGVPKAWLRIRDFESVSNLKLNLEFSFNRYAGGVMVFNILETERLRKVNNRDWLELKNSVISSWLNNEPFRINSNDIDSRVKELVRNYYELNSGRANTLKEITEVFGFTISGVLDILGLNADYIIDVDGNIVKIG